MFTEGSSRKRWSWTSRWEKHVCLEVCTNAQVWMYCRLAEALDSKACFLVCAEHANGAHIGKRILPKRHWFLEDPILLLFWKMNEFRLWDRTYFRAKKADQCTLMQWCWALASNSHHLQGLRAARSHCEQALLFRRSEQRLKMSLMFRWGWCCGSGSRTTWTWKQYIQILAVTEVYTAWIGNNANMLVNSVNSVQALCMLPLSLWVHMCVGPVGSGRHCLLGVVPSLWLLRSFWFLFHLAPWALREGIWRRRPFRTEAPRCLSSCYLVVGFCVSSYLLQKDTSLMRAEWGTVQSPSLLSDLETLGSGKAFRYPWVKQVPKCH